jgi:sugar phosphate isomerase/epimerase
LKINYCCTYWGCEQDSPNVFVDKVLAAGYEGIEISLPPTPETFTPHFLKELEGIRLNKPNFIFIAQHLTSPGTDTVEQYIRKMEKNLLELTSYNPTFINSHTGKDFYSFDENCSVIEAALNISQKTGVRILHETHRGRFSYHAASLLPYLQKFPELELVGDLSHFCTVSESLLADQQHILQEIIPHMAHLHARVGHEQGPQVNNPFAPEWQEHLAVFLAWWKEIINHRKNTSKEFFTITPEFGPAPYMPAMPFTQEPLSNQWELNCTMKDYLINQLN